MDNLSFGLSEPARILFQAGVRHLLPSRALSLEVDATMTLDSTDSDPLEAEPWCSYLAKSPPRPRMVWTYWELGADFGGAADPRRSQLLRQLIVGLELPKGSIGFWPCSVLAQGALSAQPRPFFDGLRRLQSPALVVFGQEPFHALFVDSASLLEQLTRDLAIFYAPPIMKLLEYQAGQLDAFLTSLRQFCSAHLSG